MTISRAQVALNPIQWTSLPPDPNVPGSKSRWHYGEPSFRAEYPDVLAAVAAAGFDATMMEVLDTQTLQEYERMIGDAGLRPAPGYASIGLPEDHGLDLKPGTAEWIRWFNPVRRKAEESRYFGLDSVFLAPEVNYQLPRWSEKAAVGHLADADRLKRQIDLLSEAATILQEEGVRAGLHNHVGTWIETEDEIEAVLAAVDPALLGASFDVGHLAWAGIDPVAFTRRHADRILDLHVKDLPADTVAEWLREPRPYTEVGRKDFFREPGRGDLDIDGVIAALPEDFGGWIIIEVDQVHGDPDASARASRDWVERTFAE
ncbi:MULTISPECIES: sugar phosphate isomerase/epimerase family protein [Microbacterium]|uniref:sugar phosphate isomerase/epimerase family protein n=1 Tax=Microbacterium TaxID=33882 RepID=UPI001D173BF0|nr:sugar phosphate isomerase/epimerase [Microbacterium testaceum]MCC4249099.1 sugar phosphate isomerase/epimerase [Microbacterium testaceum]